MKSVWQRVIATRARIWGMVEKGLFTHGFMPALNKKLFSNLMALNRTEMRMVTGMLTLHNGLNDNMCRLGRQTNPSALGAGRVMRPPFILFKTA